MQMTPVPCSALQRDTNVTPTSCMFAAGLFGAMLAKGADQKERQVDCFDVLQSWQSAHPGRRHSRKVAAAAVQRRPRSLQLLTSAVHEPHKTIQ